MRDSRVSMLGLKRGLADQIDAPIDSARRLFFPNFTFLKPSANPLPEQPGPPMAQMGTKTDPGLPIPGSYLSAGAEVIGTRGKLHRLRRISTEKLGFFIGSIGDCRDLPFGTSWDLNLGLIDSCKCTARQVDNLSCTISAVRTINGSGAGVIPFCRKRIGALIRICIDVALSSLILHSSNSGDRSERGARMHFNKLVLNNSRGRVRKF